MHKNIPIVVGITILFLGLAIQPSIATVQPEKIDVEPDVEGLVIQLRVTVNDILQKYGNNPMVRSLCNIILDLTWHLGKNIICTLLLIILFIFGELLVVAWIFGLSGYKLMCLLMFPGLLYIATFDCIEGFPYKSLNPLFILSETKDISELVNECPCMQE